jgi:RimJ/RimL family protein N-acetyltransferase
MGRLGNLGQARRRVNAAIEGQLVRLRRIEKRDYEIYRSFVNDREMARRVDRAGTVTKAEHAAWCAALAKSPTADLFAVEDRASETFLGLVWLYDIHPRHKRAEVRIVLGRQHGRGCGPEALSLLVGHAFGRGLLKLWADVLAFNTPAIRAFEKAGFVREGLLRSDRAGEGERLDVVRFGIVPADLRTGQES